MTDRQIPTPPPPPPSREMGGMFGSTETKASIKARADYAEYMRGWSAGFEAGKLAEAERQRRGGSKV